MMADRSALDKIPSVGPLSIRTKEDASKSILKSKGGDQDGKNNANPLSPRAAMYLSPPEPNEDQ